MSNPIPSSNGIRVHVKNDHSFKLEVDGHKWKFKVYGADLSKNLKALEAVAREGIRASLKITDASGTSSKNVERLQFTVTGVIENADAKLELAPGETPEVKEVKYNTHRDDKLAYTDAIPSSVPDIAQEINHIKDAVLNPPKDVPAQIPSSRSKSKRAAPQTDQKKGSSRHAHPSKKTDSSKLPKVRAHHSPKESAVKKEKTEIVTSFLKGQKKVKGRFDQNVFLQNLTDKLNMHKLTPETKDLTIKQVEEALRAKLGTEKKTDLATLFNDKAKRQILLDAVAKLAENKKLINPELKIVCAVEGKTPDVDAGFDFANTVFLLTSKKNAQFVSAKSLVVETKEANLKEKDYLIENGGGGDCAAKALAGARLINEGKYIKNHEARKAVHQAESLKIRQDVTAHLRDNSKEFFGEILQFQQALLQAQDRVQAQERDGNPFSDQIMNLCEKPADQLSVKEKEFLIQTYASYASKPGIWLDGPFFLGYAKVYQVDIAIVTGNHFGPFNIHSTFRKDEGDRKLKEASTLFIHFNGSDHYTIFNRIRSKVSKDEGTKLTEIVEAFNDAEKPQRVRRAFLKELMSTPENLKEPLKKLRLYDQQGYLTLAEILGTDPESFKNHPDRLVKKLKEALKVKTLPGVINHLNHKIQNNSHFEARALFYQAIQSNDSAQIAPAILELQTRDPEMYLALEELLEGAVKPEDAPESVLRMYHGPVPDYYFEQELKKRPYLEARHQFFEALKVKNQDGLETAIAQLEILDQNTYLALQVITQKNEAQAIAAHLVDNPVTKEQIKAMLYQGHQVATAKFMQALPNDDSLIQVIGELKKEYPLIPILLSEGMNTAHPEHSLPAVRAQQVPQQIAPHFGARHQFFTALALHEHKRGGALGEHMGPVLANLKEQDPRGFGAVKALLQPEIEKKLKSRINLDQITVQHLINHSDLLLTLTLDAVQEKLYP